MQPAMRAILHTVELNIVRWRAAESAAAADAPWWFGVVSSGITTINYLAMAYRHRPDLPEQCRDWQFPCAEPTDTEES